MIKENKIKKECFICEGMMNNLGQLAKKIITETEKYEYSSFMVGTILDSEIIEREDIVRSEFKVKGCLLYTSPSPRDQRGSRMPSSA